MMTLEQMRERNNALIEEVEFEMSKSLARRTAFHEMHMMLDELDQINIEIARVKMMIDRKEFIESRIKAAQRLIYCGEDISHYDEHGDVVVNF